MDFSSEVVRFVSEQADGFFITADASGKIVYASAGLSRQLEKDIVERDALQTFMWLEECPALSAEGDITEWECIDMSAKKYYKLDSARFEKAGENYCIHRITDITEYMELNRDITRYMSFFKRLSGFQTEVLKKLSDTFYELLPMLTDYFKTRKAYLLLQREGNMDITTYSKDGNLYSNYRIALNASVENAFCADVHEDISLENFASEIQEALVSDGSAEGSSYRILCGGNVSGQKYAVYLSVCPRMDRESMKEQTLLSVIRLYIENGIMREKLIYDSEHDHLTGLYNKGKYLDMLDSEYPHLDSIGIFNMDVNNLKVMNDTYGHEAGDKLLIKAANSIRKVTCL